MASPPPALSSVSAWTLHTFHEAYGFHAPEMIADASWRKIERRAHIPNRALSGMPKIAKNSESLGIRKRFQHSLAADGVNILHDGSPFGRIWQRVLTDGSALR